MRENSWINSIFGYLKKKRKKGKREEVFSQITVCQKAFICNFAILLHEESETHQSFSRGYFSLPAEKQFPH